MPRKTKGLARPRHFGRRNFAVLVDRIQCFDSLKLLYFLDLIAFSAELILTLTVLLGYFDATFLKHTTREKTWVDLNHRPRKLEVAILFAKKS